MTLEHITDVCLVFVKFVYVLSQSAFLIQISLEKIYYVFCLSRIFKNICFYTFILV